MFKRKIETSAYCEIFAVLLRLSRLCLYNVQSFKSRCKFLNKYHCGCKAPVMVCLF